METEPGTVERKSRFLLPVPASILLNLSSLSDSRRCSDTLQATCSSIGSSCRSNSLGWLRHFIPPLVRTDAGNILFRNSFLHRDAGGHLCYWAARNTGVYAWFVLVQLVNVEQCLLISKTNGVVHLSITRNERFYWSNNLLGSGGRRIILSPTPRWRTLLFLS